MAIDTNHTSFDSDSHEIALVDLGVAQSTSDIRSTPLDPDEIALPQTVVKRDGRVVAFDPNRIERAIERCFAAIGRIPCSGAGNDSRAVITDYALRVVNIASARRGVLTVETIQDAVEWTLQAAGEFEAAKAYILYRAEHAKQRHEERRIPDEVRAAFDAAEQYFPTQLQKFQFFDKYSRFDPVLGRRETWIETIDRAVHHLNWLAQRETGKSLDEIRQGTTARLRMSMLNAPTEKGGAMSSMRLLATAGPAAERDDCCLYNCSFLPVESFKAFSMALQISMAGTGVGFSVERVHVDRFPRIARQKYAAENPRQPTVVFEDSAEGWGQGLDQFLEMVAVQGLNPRIDVSQIRPAGAPLKTKGGTASGPEPLIELLDFCRKVLLRRQSETLRTIDAYDMMCVVGTAAVSGGHRRSAMICLFDRDDDLMLHAKDGEFWHENQQRFNANNSAVWPHDRRVTRVELAQQMTAMLAAGGGEPGIFNLRAALDKRPDLRKERDAEWLADPQLNPWGLDYMAYGTNPCHRGSNQVHTSEGLVSIRELAGRDDFSVLLPTGEVARAVACRTGIKPLFRVVLDDGKTIDLTKNHNLILADGHKRMVKDLRPGDQIKLATHEFATTTAEVRGNRSVASATTTLERPLVRAIPNAAKSAALAEIKDLRVTEEVFNLTVDHPLHQFAVNGVISANCGEIVLRPWAFCNLSIVVARPADTLETLIEKIEIATIIGTIQSLATNFPYLPEMWKNNCEQERLLGVDINGQLDSPVAQRADVQRELRDHAVEVNREWAALLGIRQSSSVTCVKPGGNSSVLFNCASGLHARWSQYLLRNVRVSAHSAMGKVLLKSGLSMVPEIGHDPKHPRTWVAQFVVASPDGAPTRNDRNAIQQMEYWLQVKQSFTTHNPSVTITHRDNEVFEIMAWLYEHQDWIGGMAFLPAFDANLPLLPYVEIDAAEYERRKAAEPNIDFSLLFRYEVRDESTATQELACAAGACEAIGQNAEAAKDALPVAA